MIKLYYWPTPNGQKIIIFLEESGIPYQIIPVNIRQGEQFEPEFLKIAPNNKIPAIVDSAPANGGPALPLFESGAILLYLAEKTGQFLPQDLHGRNEVLQWLFWQMAGLGPMAGQNHFFSQYASETIPFAIDRYVNETARLYKVLNQQLAGQQFIVRNEYSIADMACYPWIALHQRQQQDLGNFPHIKRWMESLQTRPAVIRANEIAEKMNTETIMTEEAKKILFGRR